MAKKSVVGVHVEISASGAKAVNELKRTDTEVRRASSSMRASINKTMHDIERDFSLPKLAKGFLSGLGIGSAIQVISMGADHFVGMFKESEEYAKKLEDRANAIGEAMRRSSKDWAEMSRGFKEPEVQRDEANKRIAELSRKLEEQGDIRQKALRGMAYAQDYDSKHIGANIYKFEGEDFSKNGMPIRMRTFFDLMLERAEGAQEVVTKIRDEMSPLVKEVVGLNEQLSAGQSKLTKAQDEMRIKEITLGAGRSAAEVRGAIGEDDTAPGIDAAKQMQREREQDALRAFDRFQRAGDMRVDDMTRRGLGTGADYKGIQEQTNSILSQILEAIRMQKVNGVYAN